MESLPATFTALHLPPTASKRKRWTRDDFIFLENAGFLAGRYELLDGEIISKIGQNRPHALAVSLLLSYLYGLFGPRRVQTQATMEVRSEDRVTNRPEPDAVVLVEAIDHTPFGTEVLLAVEVSDTTLEDDIGFKVGLYSHAGVAEYWVLDLNRNRLLVFRNPLPETSEWQVQFERTPAEDIAPLCAPENTITVADLLS